MTKKNTKFSIEALPFLESAIYDKDVSVTDEVYRIWNFQPDDIRKSLITIESYDCVPDYIILSLENSSKKDMLNHFAKFLSLNYSKSFKVIQVGYNNDDFVQNVISAKLKVIK